MLIKFAIFDLLLGGLAIALTFLYADSHPALVIFYLFGGVSFAVGAGIIIYKARKHRQREFLKKNGLLVDAEFQYIAYNECISINGEHPYLITCHWTDPATGQVHEFDSDNMWEDPGEYITGAKIRVYLDRENYDKYHVDLSFLPEFAK